MSKKLITVFGATGNQGGSVISAILGTPALKSKYAIRAVTRDPSKAAGQALSAQGVEVVAGNLGDVSSLSAAISGAYAVFGVTNYWEERSADTEFAQGKAIADASFAAGVQHLVWSSLPPVTQLTAGALTHVQHFDSKARVQAYIEANKAGSSTAATYFMPAFFMSNVKDSINPVNGVPTWAMHIDPVATRIPLLDPRADVGKFVVGALEAGPQATDGVELQGVSDWSSPQEMVATINQAAGVNVQTAKIPRDTFKSFLPPDSAEELAQNLDLIGDYAYYGKGSEAKQPDTDKFFLQGASKTSWKDFVLRNGP